MTKQKYLRITVGVLLVVVSDCALGQNNFGLSLAANYNQINYTNSSGVRNTNLKGLPGVAMNFIFQARMNSRNSSKWKQYIHTSLGYKTGSFKDVGSNLLTTWSFNYATSGIGYFSMANSKKAVNPFYNVIIYNDYLVSGVQSRGFEQYDLTNDVKRYNLSIGAGVGIGYTISSQSHCSLGLSYGRGLTNIEKGLEQIARIHHWQLSAAIFFALAKK